MKQINKVKTGEKLFYYISNSEYSYDKIAEKLDLKTSRVIYEWIKGNKLPSLEKLFNVAEILNVSVYDIVVFEPVVHC